jgi:two-component SAPR family response regulator
MCRALQVLCAAPDRAALDVLKRAVVSAEYELTGGATSAEDLMAQLDDLKPDAVVVDAGLSDTLEAVRAVHPSIRIVLIGATSEVADDSVERVDDARSAVLGIPRPGGPVR